MMRRGSTAFEAKTDPTGDMGIENHRTWGYLFWVYDIIMINDDTDGGLKYMVYVQLYLSMILGGSYHGSKVG
jgi:hypothetical protein